MLIFGRQYSTDKEIEYDGISGGCLYFSLCLCVLNLHSQFFTQTNKNLLTIDSNAQQAQSAQHEILDPRLT